MKLLLCAIAIVSATRAEAYTVMGVRDCGQWVSQRQNEQAGTSISSETWVIGYLSGMSVGRSEEFWRRDTREISNEQVYLWMDKFCRENPLSSVADGALALYYEITGG
jgi:hypothetical protein